MTTDQQWTWFVRNWNVIRWEVGGRVAGPDSWCPCDGPCPWHPDEPCAECKELTTRRERFLAWRAAGQPGAFA